MSYNLLFFNSTEIIQQADGSFTCKPNFACPKCNEKVAVKDRTFTKEIPSNLPTIISVKQQLINEKAPAVDIQKASDVIDINKQIEYIMPCCGLKILLYVGIHKEAGETPSTIISTKPLTEKWWIHD